MNSYSLLGLLIIINNNYNECVRETRIKLTQNAETKKIFPRVFRSYRLSKYPHT